MVTQTLDKITTGEVELNDWVVSKLLGQNLEKYKVLFPHICAAIQLNNAGISLIRGENVQFIHKDTRNNDPLSRVIPVELIKGNNISRAETVLGYFGFDRNAYGDHIKKNKKWWQQLNEEKLKDREIESI